MNNGVGQCRFDVHHARVVNARRVTDTLPIRIWTSPASGAQQKYSAA